MDFDLTAGKAAGMKRRRLIIRKVNIFGKGSRVCCLLGLVLVVMLLVGQGYVYGQGGAQVQRQRILDEPFRLEMDEAVPVDKRVVFDWGGWFRSSYWSLDENVHRCCECDGYHALREQELRLWGWLNIDQIHQLYARVRLDYLDWNHHTSFDRNDSDWEGPNLERGWYDFRWSRYQRAYGNQPGEVDLAVRVGRQYAELGTGLTLSIPLDALVLDSYYHDWQLTGLAARSVPSTHNVDRSVPDEPKEDRHFLGLQLRYNGHRDHEPFVYCFTQDDKGGELANNGQKYGYDTSYAGIGSRGRFFHRDLQYTLEMASAWGESYAESTTQSERQNVKAWAFDTELRYVIPDKRRSQVALEYLLTSGDSDRDFSPTNTTGGNRAHTTDDSFVGWGYRNTGLTLAPRMSNLGMVRLGASTYPAVGSKRFGRLKIGTDFYFYHKQKSGGAASDALSTKDNSYLGSEFDVFANWQITSDLAWAVHYGIFLPGDAYSVQRDRHLFYTGVTLSF